MTGIFLLGVVVLIALMILGKSVKIIGQAEVMVIERLGRFNRVGRSGLNILIPFVEAPREIDVRYLITDVTGQKRISAGSTTRIDLREQVLNFPSQPVITKDNVTIDIDAVLYYRIADPQKAAYAIQNLPFALETLTRTTLRNIVGDLELDETLASRDMINKRMREVIEEASIGWGVDVTRVELQAIEPPRDIQQSMELQMRAERERRAAVTTAEASKRAAILEAEGVQQAQINRAQGEAEAAVLRAKGLAEARLAMADAESQTIQRIASSLPHGEAATYLLGMRRDRPPVRCMPGRPVRSSPPRPRAAPRSRTTAGAERGADHARSRRTHRQGPRLREPRRVQLHKSQGQAGRRQRS